MITVNASLFPSSVANSLIAVGNDGLQERDRMVRACIAIICELGQNFLQVIKMKHFRKYVCVCMNVTFFKGELGQNFLQVIKV